MQIWQDLASSLKNIVDKKMADAFFGGFVVIMVLALSIAGASAIIKYSERNHECNANKDCASTSYCGSDFSCHIYPTSFPEKTNSWVLPSLIVGACIVAGAMIVRPKN